jgi:integrase
MPTDPHLPPAEPAESPAPAQAPAALSVQQLFDRWAAAELAPPAAAAAPSSSRARRREGGRSPRSLFERCVFPEVGDLPAAEFSRADALGLLGQLHAAGRRSTSYRLLADLRKMTHFAARQGLIPEDPLHGLTRRAIDDDRVPSGRVLSLDEIALLAMSLPMSRMKRRNELALWLILATGCRPAEVLEAQWSAVNRTVRAWQIPKTERFPARTVPLSSFALQLLGELADLGESVPWVFPNRTGKGPIKLRSLAQQLADRQRDPAHDSKRRTRAMGTLRLPGGRWTALDLRRTAAALMGTLGVRAEVIEACMQLDVRAHANPRVGFGLAPDLRAEQAVAVEALGQGLHDLLRAVPRPAPEASAE